MQFRFDDIETPPGQPFFYCRLGRSQYGDFLTRIVQNTNDGFVLSINNKWGDGKTTFLKMWQQQLKDNNYTVIYFNAWENDFEDNPLTAFMGELKKVFGGTKDYKSAVQAISIMLKEVAPAAAKGYFKNKVGEEAGDTISAAVKGFTSIIEKDIENYEKSKKSRMEFKESLQKWISNSASKTPVIFIIDELDRCRPNYSVLLLEQLKHFFSIPNITFVLAIDKEQLGHAIRGVYGSDLIDADEYLRRFIDVEYSLPKVPSAYFLDHLIKKYNLKNWIAKKAFDKNGGISFKELIYLFDQHNVSLRVQEKILAHLSIIAETHGDRTVISKVFTFLLFIKHCNRDIFDKIKFKSLSISEFEEYLKSVYETKKGFLTTNEILNIKAHILIFYYNYADKVIKANKSFYKPSTDGFTLYSNDPVLNHILKSMQQDYVDENLSHVLSLVDMVLIQ